MRPGELESELRACLRRRAAVVPPPTDLVVETVLRHARAVRRRQRTAAGALAVVLIAAVAGVALVWPWPPAAQQRPADLALDQHGSEPAPTRTAPPTDPTSRAPDVGTGALPGTIQRELVTNRTLPVDVVVADQLLTVAGSTVDLGGVGGVAEAYRVATGWLVLSRGATGVASLWYVVAGAKPRALLAEVEGIVVAPSGNRVAWRDGARVYIGTLQRDEIDAVGDAPAQGAVPVTFVGKGLLLARRSPEELAGTYAVWWPGMGESELRWRVASGVYGALPDGRTVVAQLPGTNPDEACLALLDAFAELNLQAMNCDVSMTVGAVGWISPDGRWLVAERTADESIFVDVPSAFDGEKPAIGTGPRPNGPGVWTDDHTVVFGTTGSLTRLRIDRAARGDQDAAERITIRGGNDRPVLAVPRLSS